MYWPLLILANIPMYLLIGWIFFDTGEKAKETFSGTINALIKIILIPDYVRLFMDQDENQEDQEHAQGIFSIAFYFVGCASLTYIEHLMLQKYLF